MDTITHALLGTMAARAIAPKAPGADDISLKTRMVAGATAAAFPDIDFFTRWIDKLSFITDWHRGITHSIVMLPVWAIMLGFIFALIARQPQQWRKFSLIAALSLSTHIATDLITSWHTIIFAPLSDYRLSLDWTFIIDPIFSSIILMALLLAWWSKSHRFAQVGVLVLAAYIGLQAFWHQQATRVAAEYAQAQGWVDSRVAALPQPFSPLNWKLVISKGDGYQVSYLKLYSNRVTPLPDVAAASFWGIDDYYRPRNALRWQHYTRFGDKALTKEVWQHPLLERFRRFAKYPMLYRIDEAGTRQCVWFSDLRFILPLRRQPFRYGLCRADAHAAWKLYRLSRGSHNIREAL
ncbi:MAG: hypothetical protein BMS9Abin11_1410 [Gammaproteobacteria bacterium]|nr:MAG: hypothetical protein BMS9Abin11_1410 [Gammaproteobacteria bacterium]